jgi:SEC-C motif-containing protein
LPEVRHPDGSAEGVRLAMSLCRNRECSCRVVGLEAERVEWSEEGKQIRSGGLSVTADLDLDSGEVAIEPASLAEESRELLNSVRQLLREDVVDLLRERWHRIKGQREDEWKDRDWERIGLDAMVPFLEAFPSSWDLSLIEDGERFWLLDSWCLQARCSCDGVAVEIMEDAPRKSIGMVRLDLGRACIEEISGEDVRVRRLGAATLVDPVLRDELGRRRKVMRRVARELPRLLAAAAPIQRVSKPGRNEPCPCGSGTKFKRCCGR